MAARNHKTLKRIVEKHAAATRSETRQAAIAENTAPTTRTAEIAAGGAPTSPGGALTRRDMIRAGAAIPVLAGAALAVSQASAEEHDDAELVALWREYQRLGVEFRAAEDEYDALEKRHIPSGLESWPRVLVGKYFEEFGGDRAGQRIYAYSEQEISTLDMERHRKWVAELRAKTAAWEARRDALGITAASERHDELIEAWSEVGERINGTAPKGIVGLAVKLMHAANMSGIDRSTRAREDWDWDEELLITMRDDAVRLAGEALS